MFARLFRFAAPAVVAAAVAAPAAPAQSDAPGKKAVLRLFTDVVGKVTDATVRVKSNGKDVYLGTIVDADGYILTKGDDLRMPISVRMRDGAEYDAKYIGYNRDTDLAMLKVTASDLPVVSFAAGTKAVVGNWVASTGAESEPSAVGVLSVGPRKLYQAEKFIDKGNKGFLGVMLDKPKDVDGVLITTVEDNSAAKKAKLKVGDIIVRVMDKSVTEVQELRTFLEDYKPGDIVSLKVLRDEEELEFKVKLGDRSDTDRGEFQNKMGSSLSNRRTGFPQVIMHDSVLKPADCGGPLVDLDGNVLGINIARAGRVETWALPAEVIKPLIKDLKDGKFPPPAAAAKK